MSHNCKNCKKIVSDDEEAVSCQFCDEWYHARCIGFNSSQYKILQRTENCFWFCDYHRQHIFEMIASHTSGVNKITDEIKEINYSLKDLKKTMEKQQDRSYADVLKLNAFAESTKRPPTKTSNGVIITSSSQTNYSSIQLEKIIKENINLTEVKTGVTKLKHISNDRIFLGTQTTKDSEVIEKIIMEKLGSKVKVSHPKKIMPQLIISNIEKEYNEQELWEEIKSTNHGFDDQDQIKMVHKKNYLSKENTNTKWSFIIQAKSHTYDKMINRYLNVNFNAHYVKEYITVRRCYNCQQYGHKGSNCLSPAICSRCAGTHKTSDCQKKNNSYNCVNCIDYNRKTNRKIATNHTCGGKECYIQKEKLDSFRSKINYDCKEVW